MKLLSSNLRLHLTLWLAWTNENFSENVIYDLVAHDINVSSFVSVPCNLNTCHSWLANIITGILSIHFW